MTAFRGDRRRRLFLGASWTFAGFLGAGTIVGAELGELTTSTSPLRGAKWDLVVVLGSLEIAVAAATMLAAVWVVVGQVVRRSRGDAGVAA